MKAIVTGHTKGLGAALANNLLDRGVPVLGLARTHAPEMAAADPDLFEEVELDLADAPAVSAWLAGRALADYVDGSGAVLLLNNAGMVSPVGPLDQQDPLAVMRAVALNVAVPLALSAAVMRASEGAQLRILHISSGAGRNPYPGWSVYCATKAALDQLARSIKADQVVHPRESGDVGDRVRVAHDPGTALQLVVQHAEQAFRFGHVAVARALVLVILAGELVEEAELAEHRPDAGHLEH